MASLRIVIKQPYFDHIAEGSKTIEYSEIKTFWESRLYDSNGKKRKYDNIEFVNGYNSDAKKMTTKYEGVSRKGSLFQIKVGKIVKRKF